MERIPLGGAYIEVSQELDDYNTFRLKYKSLSEKAKNDFENNYFSMFKNMDDLHLNCQKNVVEKYLVPAVDQAIKDLISYDIEDVDDDTFLIRYLDPLVSFKDETSKVFEKYLKIILDAEEYEEFKKQKTGGGPGFIGGGFGLEGAAQGMAVAAAANLAVSILTSILNVTTEGLNSIGDSLKKDQIFRDKDTISQLSKAVFNLVFQVHIALIDAIKEKTGKTPYHSISKENRSKAQRMFENVRKGRIESDRIKAQLISVISMNPYAVNPYIYWLDKYGDIDGNLESLAEYFGLNEVSIEKVRLVETFKTNLPFDTPQICDVSLSKFEKYTLHLGLKNLEAEKNELSKSLNKKREKLVWDYLAKLSFDEKNAEQSVVEFKRFAKSKGYDDCEIERLFGDRINSEIKRAKSQQNFSKFLFCLLVLFWPFCGLVAIKRRYGLISKVFCLSWLSYIVYVLIDIYHSATLRNNTQHELNTVIFIIIIFAVVLLVSTLLGLLAEKILDAVCQHNWTAPSVSNGREKPVTTEVVDEVFKVPAKTNPFSMKPTSYICQGCSTQYEKWRGKCEECGQWNTIIETPTSY